MLGIIAIAVCAAALIPIIALVVAVSAHNRFGDVERRLGRLEHDLRRLEATVAARPEATETLVREPNAHAIEAAVPSPQADAEPHASPAGLAASAAAAAASAPSFASDLEERVGGRLTVWLGAATLVLAGGFW